MQYDQEIQVEMRAAHDLDATQGKYPWYCIVVPTPRSSCDRTWSLQARQDRGA